MHIMSSIQLYYMEGLCFNSLSEITEKTVSLILSQVSSVCEKTKKKRFTCRKTDRWIKL